MKLYVVKVDNNYSFYNKEESAMKLFEDSDLFIYTFDNKDDMMNFITTYSSKYESINYVLRYKKECKEMFIKRRKKMIVNKNLCKILSLLVNQELTVTDISEMLHLSQPLASTRLKILKERDILKSRREKSKVFYSINEEKRSTIMSLLNSVDCL